MLIYVLFLVITASEQNGVMSTISDKSVPVKNFTKHCEQRRKFPILYKIEFQVSSLLYSGLLCNYVCTLWA